MILEPGVGVPGPLSSEAPSCLRVVGCVLRLCERSSECPRFRSWNLQLEPQPRDRPRKMSLQAARPLASCSRGALGRLFIVLVS